MYIRINPCVNPVNPCKSRKQRINYKPSKKITKEKNGKKEKEFSNSFSLLPYLLYVSSLSLLLLIRTIVLCGNFCVATNTGVVLSTQSLMDLKFIQIPTISQMFGSGPWALSQGTELFCLDKCVCVVEGIEPKCYQYDWSQWTSKLSICDHHTKQCVVHRIETKLS